MDKLFFVEVVFGKNVIYFLHAQKPSFKSVFFHVRMFKGIRKLSRKITQTLQNLSTTLRIRWLSSKANTLNCRTML